MFGIWYFFLGEELEEKIRSVFVILFGSCVVFSWGVREGEDCSVNGM